MAEGATRRARLAALVLVAAGLMLRLYHFAWPPWDMHHVRQADTAGVARNLLRHGFDLLHPRVDWAGGPIPGTVESEFPLYGALVAALWAGFGPEWWAARLVSVGAWGWATWALWDLVRRRLGGPAALGALGLWCFSPLGVFFTRTVQPDSLAVSAAVIGAAAFDRWVSARPGRGGGWALLAMSAWSVALLVKVTCLALLPVVPALGLTAVDRARGRAATLACLPLPLALAGAWYVHAWRDLGAGGATFGIWGAGSGKWGGPESWLSAGLWRSVVGVAVAEALLPVGVALILAAPFTAPRRREILPFAAPLAGFAALVLAAGPGVAAHNYYQLGALPWAAAIAGASLAGLVGPVQGREGARRRDLLVVVSALIVLPSFGLAWRFASVAYAQDSRIPEVARRVHDIVPRALPVVLCDRHPQSVIFASDRRGWHRTSLDLRDVADLVEAGAGYLVITDTCASFKDEGAIRALTARYWALGEEPGLKWWGLAGPVADPR